MTYAISDTVYLIGQGYDLEDGALSDDQLTWYDGATPLGTGTMLSVGPPAPGAHVIALRVTDSDANVGTDCRTIYVGSAAPAALYLPIVLRRSSP